MNSFRVWRVIGRSLSIWFKNIIPFSILLLLVNSPVVLYSASMAEPGVAGDLTMNLAQLCLTVIATGAVTYGVFQQLRGQHASIGACLAVGLRRLFPVIGVGILMGLLIIGVCLPFLLIAFASSSLSFLCGIVGAVAATIVYCMLWVSVPVAVVERPGALASLGRSRELTSGNKTSIFGILFLLGLMEWGITWLMNEVLGGVLEVPMQIIIAEALDVILGGILSVAAAVGYHDLRADKEGTNIEDLVKVFE